MTQPYLRIPGWNRARLTIEVNGLDWQREDSTRPLNWPTRAPIGSTKLGTQMNITSWCFTLKWRRMPKETPHDVLGLMWQEGFLASLIVKTILTLLERIGGALVLYSMCHSIAHWDIMANRFYQTFYIPSPSTSMLGHEMRMRAKKGHVALPNALRRKRR